MELKARCKERFEPVVQAIRQLQKEKEGLDEPLIVAIDGRCGSGKTTLISLLLGLYVSDHKGEIYYNDRPLGDLDMISLRQKKIGSTPVLVDRSI